MKQTHQLLAGGYYMFESLSSTKSMYFNSKEEIRLFKVFLSRYLGRYVKIHRVYIDVNGYNILLRLNQRRTLKNTYRHECLKKNIKPKTQFLEEPWRIISERIRIFHATFAKAVNKIRGREGVLVKSSYKKYYFENEEELIKYISEMDEGKVIKSQRNDYFECLREGTEIVNWLIYRAQGWIEKTMDNAFQSYLVRRLLQTTLSHHAPYYNPHPN